MRSVLMFVVTIALAAVLDYISLTYPQYRGYVHLFYAVAILVVAPWGIALYAMKRHKRR